ncbi:hypothetical protein AO268_30685 [Pseudomonas sp. ICMP 8385]|uniref:hypothetical protein n=1 Tax=Pseudomonas sp. ICMP 8385 TaxID=1718920 RepID=UPI000C07D2CF|nr:hypothetical protein [Pseudomonas sp. ICMP 8385]PHN59690.1 hypothetical protein AO268_30685 [Pseudomonas sp. ICMP 8385]
MKKLIAISLLLAVAIAIYTQFTLFIVPPIGVVPEGRTVIILRLNKMNFVDSPDAMCDRMQGGVSLLCRGMTMAGVVEKSKIIARLPYSDWLYLLSTNGKRFDH